MKSMLLLSAILFVSACTPREYYLFRASETLYPSNRAPYYLAARALNPKDQVVERRDIKIEFPVEYGSFLLRTESTAL